MRTRTVAIVSLVFSILFVWYSRNTGQEHWYVVWGPFLMAGGALLLLLAGRAKRRSIK